MQLALVFAREKAGLHLARVDHRFDASMRRSSDSFDISSEKTATTLPSRTAAFCAMLMAQRGFSHAGARGDDDQLGVLQAAGHRSNSM
jgi:hypothetical protein